MLAKKEQSWFADGISYQRISTRWIECSSLSQYLFSISVWVATGRTSFFLDESVSISHSLLTRTCQMELIKETIVPAKTNLLLKTWLSHVGTTSIEQEHEIIEEKSNQVIIRTSGVLVGIDFDSSSQIIKRKISSIETMKSLIKPKIIQFDTELPKRPSDSFAYHFRTRPSDNDSWGHVNNGKYLQFAEDAKWVASKKKPFGEIGNEYILNDTYKIYIEYNLPVFTDDLVLFIWHIHQNVFGLELCKDTQNLEILSRMKLETRLKESYKES